MAKSNYQKMMERIKSNIAKRLIKAREHFGYSQARMASLLGISKATYGKNERGIHLLTTLSLIRLNEQLNVSTDWILFNRGSMTWKEEEEIQKLKQDEIREIKQEEIQALTQEMQTLTLERERVEQEKAIRRSTDVFSLEVEEMIEIMKQVPLLRHSVMGYYQRFKMKYKDLIEEQMGTEKKEEVEEDPKD